MLEHPAWHTTIDGPSARAMRTPTGTWQIIASGDCQMTLINGDGAPPVIDVYDPAALDDIALPAALRAELQELGPVRRVRNADLWDALVTAIIRQVIRAGQAAKMYQALLSAVGQPAGDVWLTPTAEQILSMPPDLFTILGMAFKRRPLQAAAEGYLQHHREWTAIPGDALVKALQTVPRIGPWTAGAAVADYTGDFALYPYGDLAVRTWARRADPASAWPDDEPSFASTWQHLAGPHVSTLTALTLAWGDHDVHQPPAHPRRPR